MYHSNSASFLSQDDSRESGNTPSEHYQQHNHNEAAYSPQNKKKRGRFFAIFGKSNAENRLDNEPSHFNMSQDDSNQNSLSQFSQDFSDRLGAYLIHVYCVFGYVYVYV